MATFKPNSDTKVEADEPKLDVLASQANPLKVGKHVFRLVVRDDGGNESDPALVTIIVVDTERPTAVIDVINAAGERITSPEVKMSFGQPFTLTGERSTDIGGSVVLWGWELLQA